MENIVQGISRDILCHAMNLLRQYRIVYHIHDEIIIECPMNTDATTISSIMGTAPAWASDLNLRTDGYSCTFYQKDS